MGLIEASLHWGTVSRRVQIIACHGMVPGVGLTIAPEPGGYFLIHREGHTDHVYFYRPYNKGEGNSGRPGIMLSFLRKSQPYFESKISSTPTRASHEGLNAAKP